MMSEREAPDLRNYVEDLRATLRQRDPAAYRAFVGRWRDLLQRGAAEQVLAMDDAALRRRMEQMILDNPGLADLHAAARAALGAGPAGPEGAPRRRTVRLRRRTPRTHGEATPGPTNP